MERLIYYNFRFVASLSILASIFFKGIHFYCSSLTQGPSLYQAPRKRDALSIIPRIPNAFFQFCCTFSSSNPSPVSLYGHLNILISSELSSYSIF